MRGPGIQQFADNPGEVTLFEYALGTKTIFGLLEKNAEQKQSFDDYMRSRRLVDAPQWFDIYPAAKKFANARKDADAILLVDIGGGPGQELERFKQSNPNIPGRFVLQDLPITLKRIDKMADGVEAMEYEFREGKLLLSRSDEEKAPIIQRLRRIEGQVRGLIQMVEADRYCMDEVQQASAVAAAVREVALMILTSHLDAGVAYAVSSGESEAATAEVSSVLRAALRL